MISLHHNHIISYQISFCPVPVQIFQAVIILSPSMCLQFLVGFAFGTFSAQLAPCIASCVETRFKRTVKSKVESHGKLVFWHLQVRLCFPSFCTFRCIFLATRSTPIFSIPPFSRALMCEKISASAVEGIEAMNLTSVDFDDMCGSGRYVTIHPMPTTVVPSTQMPFPLSMNDSGCFVFV